MHNKRGDVLKQAPHNLHRCLDELNALVPVPYSLENSWIIHPWKISEGKISNIIIYYVPKKTTMSMHENNLIDEELISSLSSVEHT